MSTRISRTIILRVAVQAGVDERTVRRRLRGERGKDGTDTRIEEASDKFGLKLPKVKDQKQSAA